LGIDPARIKGTGPQGRISESDVLAHAKRMESTRITPTARRLAEASGIDVTAVQGSGIRGKITKADVAGAAAKPEPAPPPRPTPGAQRIPLTPMRRIIAKRMTESKFSAPHYYITVEIDMAAAKQFRAQCTTFTPSFNDLVLRATVKALCDFPGINAKWLGDAIEHIPDINLGVAVALPGGLIVPVLKQAQDLSLEGIVGACKTLVEKARTGKLLPDDFTGNTFTVSNLGPFGVDHFTAIINQPDSAIMAVGQMKDRVVVVEDGIHIRPIMKVTLSSDHRVVDGALAAQFMARFKEIMELADFA
jgi:pyruvate dehydrogenase E2 component (dihydrolipoamide acetyltransferase)